MQQHLLQTFVDWAKLIFFDARMYRRKNRRYRWTDRRDSRNSDLDLPEVLHVVLNKMGDPMEYQQLFDPFQVNRRIADVRRE